MRLRDFLPRAGWMTLAFIGFGAGAAVALVSPAPEPTPSARTVVAAGPHCRIAATMPVPGQMAEVIKTYESGDPPLWTDLGTLSYPVSTKNAASAGLFRSRHQASGELQSCRGAPRLPQGAEPRSELRHVLCR